MTNMNNGERNFFSSGPNSISLAKYAIKTATNIVTGNNAKELISLKDLNFILRYEVMEANATVSIVAFGEDNVSFTK